MDLGITIEPDKHYTTKEVAALLDLEEPFVMKLMRDGLLPHIDHSRRLKRVPGAALQSYLESRYREGSVA